MRDSVSFREAVYRALREVPKGRVVSYADLARAVGRPGASRAVGTAMRLNDDGPHTPCHRVVHNDGRLGEYSSAQGRLTKAKLLAQEGVRVREGRILDFERVRWRPE